VEAGRRVDASVPGAEAEPFFSAPSGVAVLLFVANNFVWKSTSPGVLTGKLSDFCACFFLPLYLSALLGWVVERPLAWRLRCGAALTCAGFAAVKTLTPVSVALNGLVAGLTGWTGVSLRPNQVDPTDLIALVMVPVAVAYARTRRRPLLPARSTREVSV
jgi:hypothetical protein